MRGLLLHAITYEDGCVLGGKFISSPFYALVILLFSLNWEPSITGRWCKAKQLEEEASQRTMGARKSSGCCLRPQDDWSLCWEALHSRGDFCHHSSWLDAAVGTDRGSRTWQRCYRKWDDREEALSAVWRIKPPDSSLYFLRFDRNTTSDSCCCYPCCKLPCVWLQALA